MNNQDQEAFTGPLRDRAERSLVDSPRGPLSLPDATLDDLRRLVHELRVHEVELELQNDDLRAAQVELSETLDDYQELYDLAPVGYLTLDDRGVILRANDAASRLLGIRRDALRGQSALRFVEPEQDRVWTFLRGLFQRPGEVERLEVKTLTPAGFRLDLLLEAHVTAAGARRRCLLSLIDVSERRRERAKSRRYLQAAESLFIGLDLDGRVNLANRKACKLLGYTSKSIVGKDWFEHFVPAPRRLESRAAFRAAIENDDGERPVRAVESVILSRSGRPIQVTWHHTRTVDDRGRPTGVLYAGKDLSAQRRAETATIKIEAYLRATFEAIGDAIMILAERGLIESANPSADKMFGVPEGGLIGHTLTELMSESCLQMWGAEIDDLVDRGEGPLLDGTPHKLLARRSGGESFPAEMSACRIGGGGERRIAGVLRDISERKAMTEALIRQEGLARLGELSAVIAHEVKNPLSGIIGAAALLEDAMAEGSAEREVIVEIRKRSEQLIASMKALLAYGRSRLAKKTPRALRPLLLEAIAVVKDDPSSAGLTIALDCPELIVPCEPLLLRSALLNLMMNAAEAMLERDGRIAVAARTEGRMAVIVIQDDGPGIPKDKLDHIYDLFFTTKKRGTGLGLAVARRTIELHGGTLAITCPDEGGTRAELRLPLDEPR